MAYKYGVDNRRSNKSKKFNILIVDDDKISAELFQDFLALRGHNVSSANEGVKCISQCLKNNYDIIFLDYHIGDINGVELADCLKSALNVKSKIYAYTGDDSPDSMKKFREIGMNGVVIKPLTLAGMDNIMSNMENEGKNTTNKQTSNIIYF